MCEFFSGIIKRDTTVLADLNTNSHENIIAKFKLDDSLPLDSRDWIRFEFSPKKFFSKNRKDWIFKVDENSKPKWVKTAHKLAVWNYLLENVLDQSWFTAAASEVERISNIQWFKPMDEPDIKFLEKKALEIRDAFKLKSKNKKVKVRLIRLGDYAAWAAAWDAAWDAARDAARAAAWAAARDAARAAAWDAAWDAARAAARDAAWDAAWDAARAAAGAAAWDAAGAAAWAAAWAAARDAAFEVSADVNKKYKTNPFKHYVDLWEMGYCCCGIYNNTLTLGYVPKKEKQK